MTSLPCDIVLLPSPSLEAAIINLSQKLKSPAALFTLDGKNYFAHASLYMLQLKVADLDKVGEILAGIAAIVQPLDLLGVKYEQEWGFLDVEFDRTEVARQLQATVITEINPLRDGLRDKDKPRLAEATGVHKENLEQYGYRFAGELFRPHSTITRFSGDLEIDIAELPDPASLSGQFTRLGLFELGDNGTCVREIAAFNLG